MKAYGEREVGGPPESWPELHEEIRRLPERYRVPVVLCYLEGLSTDAVATRLGCPKGTVLSRLSRARERLRGRLARRGLALPTPSLFGGRAPRAAPAAIPPRLLTAAVRASLTFVEQPAIAACLSDYISDEIEWGNFQRRQGVTLKSLRDQTARIVLRGAKDAITDL
jgi:hypothetical protein